MRKLTYEFVKSEFERRGYRLISEEYVNVSSKLKYECPKHLGRDNNISYNDLRNGAGCRYCGTEKRDAKRRVPFEKVKQTFKERGYKLIETKYVNRQTPLRYICPHHPDKELSITYASISRGAGCSYCSGVGKPTIREVQEEFKKRGYKLLTKTYKNSATRLEFICEKHPDRISQVSYGNFKGLGHGCTYCTGNFLYEIEDVVELFEEAGYRLLEKQYINNTTPMRFECPKHKEKENFISLKVFNKGSRCRFCYIEGIQGEGHPNYNHGMTKEDRERKRAYPEYQKWREDVFRRDQYTCKICGDNQGGNLVAHHLDGYGWCVKRRVDINNGVTLCEGCHKEFHTEYGYKDNTEQQFHEWLKTVSSEERGRR